MALVLKAAMPLLATASAHAQGKTLVEVCTVYGVALVPLDAQGGAPAPDHATLHGGEQCLLTALAITAPADMSALGAVPVTRRDESTLSARVPSPTRDACASWVARLQHGPPGVA